MKEINRESNTFGTQSADEELTATSIAPKVLMEQMHERVQNYENCFCRTFGYSYQYFLLWLGQ